MEIIISILLGCLVLLAGIFSKVFLTREFSKYSEGDKNK